MALVLWDVRELREPMKPLERQGYEPWAAGGSTTRHPFCPRHSRTRPLPSLFSVLVCQHLNRAPPGCGSAVIVTVV
jgi:hypothetical protein